MILILLFVNIVYSTGSATSCDEQLKNFYIDLGLPPATPTEQVINFTSGVLLGVPFVTLGINVQQAATNYANAAGFTPLPNNSYFSIDLPFCWTNITYTCVDRIIYGITHLSNCTLKDRDTSFGSNTAGRLFIYPDPNPPCSGTASVTIYNVTLGITNTSNATYDIQGIFNGILKTESEAIFEYRNDACDYSNGTASDISFMNQFTCLYYELQCADPRPVNDVIITPVNLTYGFRCVGPVVGTGNSNSIVRVINHNESIGGIETEFDLSFVSTLTGDPLFTTYPRQLIKPQIIRQFEVGTIFTNYEINSTYGGYNGTITPISLFPIADKYLPQIPCVCNLTIFCDTDGNIDLSSDGTLFYINNTIPVAICNTSTPFVRQGFDAFLNDDGSYDPDVSPFNLTYYWIEGLGPNNVNITIVNPTDLVNVTFTTFLYVLGTYEIVELVGDGQDVNSSVCNITAVTSTPFCDISGGSQIFGNVNETIYLNASLSQDALNATLVGFWIQISGFPVFIENNDTIIANFTPTISGTYLFQVNITNGLENCTFQLLVQVNPTTFAPINDPNGTLPPFEIPPNRTVPPIDINETDIPFVSDPPLSFAPANGSVTPVPTGPTPVFPPFPGDNTTWHMILFWVLFAIFLGLWLLLLLWMFMEKNDDESRFVIPNKYITIKYT